MVELMLSCELTPPLDCSDHKPVFAEFEITPTAPVTVNPSLAASESAVVEICELSASDLPAMDLTGTSDPYVRVCVCVALFVRFSVLPELIRNAFADLQIKFYSVPSAAMQVESTGGHPATSTIKSTLNPKYETPCLRRADVTDAHVFPIQVEERKSPQAQDLVRQRRRRQGRARHLSAHGLRRDLHGRCPR